MKASKSKPKGTRDDGGRDQARLQVAGIVEMVKALESADNGGTEPEREDARRTIDEDPLSVEVREGWHAPGEKGEVSEFCILLCTGGPACRIVGTLGRYDEPDGAYVEYQDWGTPWTEYDLTSAERDAVLAYARQFYYGCV